MKKTRKESALFQLIDRQIFDRLVEKWGMDKWVREFSTWEMTCALITALTMRLESYREVEQSLGIPRATLGDAMTKRYSGFFVELCHEILLCIRAQARDRKVKRAIRQVLAIDSTEIRVHGSLFSTPRWKQTLAAGRRAAAKLHVVWNVNGEWVDDYIVTGGRHHDSPVARLFQLKAGNTYVFDRAYGDVSFWLKIMNAQSDFVTRLKSFSRRKLEEGKKAALKNHDGVLYDGLYKPSLYCVMDIPPQERMKVEFRYIVYRDPLTKKVFHFVTSDRRSSAQAIADIYKQRWAVELLFRWMKGHLNIGTLAAKNKNAVKIHLAVSVLLQLLLRLKKMKDRYDGTLWELLRATRTALAVRSLAASEPPDGCRWRGLREKALAPSFL